MLSQLEISASQLATVHRQSTSPFSITPNEYHLDVPGPIISVRNH